MKKLLVVAYLFPPAGVVGVYRTLKFVKYLPQFGWEPVVLTVSNGKFPLHDESLLQLIPEGVQVHRCASWEPLSENASEPSSTAKPRTLGARVRNRLYLIWNWMALPDPKIGWLPNAYRAARRLMREQSITHVYISGIPFSSFLIGAWIKEIANVRVALDYRDPWTQNLNYPRRTVLHSSIDRALEQWVVRKSNLVISNTRHNNERMASEFGAGQLPSKFIAIHNGFDAGDFAPVAHTQNNRFTITYAGAFYYSVGSNFAGGAGDETMQTYSPLYFFEALQQFLARRANARDSVRVRFMGPLGHGYDPIIRERGLEAVVERLGYLDYNEHLRELKQSDVHLLVMSRGEKSRGWIPSKFFQYLGTGNPILALAPAGEVRDILAETRAGICVEPDDVAAASQAIEKLYDAWKSGAPIAQRNESAIAAYERRNLTARLAQALDSM